jgi:hypothetical protein
LACEPESIQRETGGLLIDVRRCRGGRSQIFVRTARRCSTRRRSSGSWRCRRPTASPSPRAILHREGCTKVSDEAAAVMEWLIAPPSLQEAKEYRAGRVPCGDVLRRFLTPDFRLQHVVDTRALRQAQPPRRRKAVARPSRER